MTPPGSHMDLALMRGHGSGSELQHIGRAVRAEHINI